MSWGKVLTTVATTLLAGGIAWLVSNSVHSNAVQAVQDRDIAEHGEKLQDHELRTRSLEGVVHQISETQKATAAILERLEKRVDDNEAPARRTR